MKRIDGLHENQRETRHWIVMGLVLALSLFTLSAFTLSLSAAESEADHESPELSSGKDSDQAQESEKQTAEDYQDVIYDRVMVVGDASSIRRVPGSAHFLTEIELEKHQNTDLHRILRQVPGINIQEEDGFGLRPNIGIRGTGVERSQKITLMEDGVLIAPAPYAAPAAYYTPTAGRMESIEVRKGSAAIKQGPQTNGGAINLLSTSIPSDLGGELNLSFGDHSMGKVHANFGASYDRFGFVVETFQQQTDGFKDLDNGDETGFELQDYLVKFRFNSAADARFYQALELKLGRTDQVGDETYLGLTRGDFESTPFRRYAGSQVDEIDTEHEQIQLRHFLQLRSNLDLTTTLYRNDYFRDWFKNESTLGVSNSRILNDPTTYATELSFLRGDADSPDDAFALRHNRRDYYSQGIQSILGWQFETGNARHALEFGVRVHEDEEDRFQEEDLYAMRDGSLVLTSIGAPGSQANRIGRAEALAFFVQNQINLGKWTFTPGLRYELIDTERLDYGRNDPGRTGTSLSTRENEIDAVIPGLGISYAVKPGWDVFVGVHRGFSPPSPSSREPVEEERSTNYELGTRLTRNGWSLDVVGFFNDYSNLLGADTASGGGTGSGDLFNGGAVDVEGLEFGFNTNLSGSDAFRLPLRLTYTYTQAEFQSSFLTSFADWSPEVTRGDELPYLPENQFSAELGFEQGDWSVFLASNYVSEMRTNAGQGAIPENERIEDRVTFDLSGNLKLFERYRVFAQVRNLFDETYVVANRPYGLRPGLPRTALVGVAIDF